MAISQCSNSKLSRNLFTHPLNNPSFFEALQIGAVNCNANELVKMFIYSERPHARIVLL
jgi:hypothetical protein